MNKIGLEQIVRDVFGPIPTQVINGWLSFKCPIATWTHESGKDSRASAGLSIKDQGTSVFNCFTCGNKMPLAGLLRKFAGYTGEDLEGLIEEVEEEQYLGPRSLPEWDAREEDKEQVALKQSVYLDLYDSAAGHWYLQQRGISDETAVKLGLMIDPCDPADGSERILFPVFGADGELYGLSGRDTTGEALLKVRDYYGLKKAQNLLGAHLIAQENPDKVIVCEGLFDYANMWEQGFPAVAAMHSTLTERQAAILRSFGKPTYLFYDDDEAGQKGVNAAGKALFDYLPCMKVKYPEVWIVDAEETDTEPEQGHYIKDPGELLREDIEAMIENRRLWFPY